MTREDPKVVLKLLLQNEWDDTNVDGITPNIRTGWRDENLQAPQVTAGPDEESPTSDTGFTGMSGSGSGPTSRVQGTVNVNAWVSDEVIADDQNPKDIVDSIADEIERIVNENYDIANYTDPGGNPLAETDAYRYISYLGRSYMPEDPGEPEAVLIHRYRVTIGYSYLRHPDQ